MAVSILQYPPSYGSAHDHQYFVLNSSNKAQPNFKYVVDIYVGGVKIATAKPFGNPSAGNSAAIDVAPYIRSYLNTLYFVGGKTVIQPQDLAGKLWVVYDVKLGEEYGTPVTTYTNLLTATGFKAYNSAVSLYPIHYSQPILDYKDLFLTRRPRAERLALTDFAYTGHFNPDGGTATFTITKYDASGASMGSHVFANSTKTYSQIGFGPANINTIWPDFIDSAVSYYTYQSSSHSITDTITVIVECFKRFQGYNLTFLNGIGAYDTVPFKFKSTRTTTVEKKGYGTSGAAQFFSDNGAGDVSGGIVDFSLEQYGTTGSAILLGQGRTYSVKGRQRFKLNTDFLSDDYSAWLAELVASPVVYMQFVDAGGLLIFYPVKVLADNYQYLSKQNDKTLTPLEIEVEVLTSFNSQLL
jgi:hypothetical protein